MLLKAKMKAVIVGNSWLFVDNGCDPHYTMDIRSLIFDTNVVNIEASKGAPCNPRRTDFTEGLEAFFTLKRLRRIFSFSIDPGRLCF